MKKKYLFLCILTTNIFAEKISLPANIHDVNININNNQYSQTTQNQSNSNTNTNITTITTHIKTSVSNFISIVEQRGKKYGIPLLQWILKHKKRVVFFLGITIYGILYAYLYYVGRYIKDSNAWHSWKSEFSFEEMALLDLESLSKALFITIQEKYFKHQDPKNSLLPLILFYNDLQLENQKLDRYIMISSILQRCFLSSFFPISKEQINVAQQKKQRLSLLKKLFVSFMAQQNATAITRNPPCFFCSNISSTISKNMELRRSI